jgi:hypothetical protein
MITLTQENKRILEIMGISPDKQLIVEGEVPPQLVKKVAKFLEEILPKYGDEGVERNVDEIAQAAKRSGDELTDIEIKFLKENLDEIVAASKLVDPASSVIFKDFTKIITKISEKEVKALADKAITRFVEKNPAIDNVLKNTIDELDGIADKWMKGELDSIPQDIKEYLQNGGTFEELFSSTLKGSKDDLGKPLFNNDLIEHYMGKYSDELDGFGNKSRNADEFIKNPEKATEKIRQEATVKGLPPVSWWTKWASQEMPRIYELFKSKFGVASREVAEKDAKEILEQLFDSKKLQVTEDMQQSDVFNVIMQLKEELKQAGNFYQKKPANEVWKTISEDLNKTPEGKKFLNYIENYSHGDDFSSIKKFLEETEQEYTRKDGLGALENSLDVRKKLGEIKKDVSDFGGDVRKKESLYVFGKDKIILFMYNFSKRVIKACLNNRIFNLLFFENFKFLREINQMIFKGGIRSGALYINLFKTWWKLVVTKFLVTPIIVLINNTIDAISGWLGQDVSTDYSDNFWKETFRDIVREMTFNVESLDIELILRNFGTKLIPIGKGPIFNAIDSVLEWLGVINIKKNVEWEDLTKKLEQEFNDEVSKLDSRAADVAKKMEGLTPNELAELTTFKTTLTSDLIKNKYYKLTPEQTNILTKFAYRNVDGKYFEIQDPEDGNIIYKIKLKPLDDKSVYDGDETSNPFYFQVYSWDNNGKKETLKKLMDDHFKPKIFKIKNKEFNPYTDSKLVQTLTKGNTQEPSQKNESIKRLIKNIIMEDTGKKFGEDNFKHWKDTFTFKSGDDKNPGQYKEVKINMEDVMDRIDHFRKKYDEDDAFVRAVIDTHEDVVKIMYTKGLADIRESVTPRGLALVLRTLNESRGEMEIFSVARPANGNWFLVKGDYTQSQLANMDLEKKEPEDKEKKKDISGSEELKKKEEKAIRVLKSNEKEGLDDLPKKVREKLLEKMGRGWTTETPPSFLEKLVEKSQINTIFNDKIDIFKLDSNDDTFDAIVDNSSQIFIKKGFCRSLYIANDNANLDEKQEKVVNHILEKCDRKFGGKLGVRNF